MFSYNKCIILKSNLAIIFSVAFDYLVVICRCSDEMPVTERDSDELSIVTEMFGV